MYKLEVITNQTVNGEQVKFDIDFKDLKDFQTQMENQENINSFNLYDKYGVYHVFNGNIVFRLRHYEMPDTVGLFDFLNIEKKDNGEK